MLHLVWWVSWTNVTLALPDVRRCSCDMLPDVIFLHVISGRTNVTSSWANVTLGLSTIPDVTLALPDVTCKNITSGNMLHVFMFRDELMLEHFYYQSESKIWCWVHCPIPFFHFWLRQSLHSNFPISSASLTWKNFVINCCLGSTTSFLPIEDVFPLLSLA